MGEGINRGGLLGFCLVVIRDYGLVRGTPRLCVSPLLASHFLLLVQKKVTKENTPQSHSWPK
jgi:hypothetical protein